METSCNRRYLIRKGLYELEIHDLCFLYEKYDFDDWECREQDDLIVRMYDYICGKDRAFDTRQISTKKDGQLIFHNNSSYLLVDASNIKEALDIFWAKQHTIFYEKLKTKENLEDN